MDAIYTNRYSVDIPKSDVSFFHNMTRRMGWNVKKQPIREQHEFNKTTLQAIKDVREGKTFKADSAANLIAQLND